MTLEHKAKIPLRGQLFINEPLSDYTSWHVGGIAKQLYKPADVNDLVNFLKQLPAQELVIWLGLGSNVLIRDGGIDGVVIYTQGCLKELTLLNVSTVRAEAGVTCAKLAKFCARQGLAQGAFFAGIPGTVGGALAMNAGAFGGETWRQVVAVETMDRFGITRIRGREAFGIAYREVKKPEEEWFIAGHFYFPPGDENESNRAIRDLLRQRAQTQPVGEFNCGSVFRNPPGDHAARLIEFCGLKGKKIGGAWVSTKHANFIINGGDATAADIEQLIQWVRQTVEQKTGVVLIPECHIIGEKLPE